MFKLFLFLFFLTAPAMAQGKELTAEEQKLVGKIEAYFNSIKTIKSKEDVTMIKSAVIKN